MRDSQERRETERDSVKEMARQREAQRGDVNPKIEGSLPTRTGISRVPAC